MLRVMKTHRSVWRVRALVKGKWDRRDISANIIDYKHLHTQDSHWHFGPYSATIAPINRVSRYLGGGFGVMNQNIEVITYAVSLIFKAAIIAAKYSGSPSDRPWEWSAILTKAQENQTGTYAATRFIGDP